jgi:hypothetical protein
MLSGLLSRLKIAMADPGAPAAEIPADEENPPAEQPALTRAQVMALLAEHEAAIESRMRAEFAAKPQSSNKATKIIDMKEKLNRSSDLDAWLKLFIAKVAPLNVSDSQWLQHLLANVDSNTSSALLTLLGVSNASDLYGDPPKRAIPWTDVEPAVRKMHEQANGVTPYSKVAHAFRLRHLHYEQGQTFSDTYAEASRRISAAFGDPPADPDSPVTAMSNLLVMAAFFNALPGEHVARLQTNPATGQYWLPSELPQLSARVVSYMAEGQGAGPSKRAREFDAAAGSSKRPNGNGHHKGNGGHHSNGGRHANPSGSKSGPQKKPGGWAPGKPYRAFAPPASLKYDGEPWVHRGGQLAPELRDWYYQHSICFQCGKCGHNPKDCREPKN